MRKSAAATAIALLLAAPASAGETAWQEVAPGVKLRLIGTGQVKPDGTSLIGLEIDMPQTTKTYWKVPGDTGMPAEFTFEGQSVTQHEVLWPMPLRDQQHDYLDYAYFGPTVLPIVVQTAGNHPVADLSVVLGVCSDICVPAQARFSLPLADAAPDRANGLRIRQALALAPEAWPDGPQPVGDVVYHADQDAIAVHITDPDIDPQTLIAAVSGGGEPVFGTPQKSPEPDLVLIPVRGRADASALAGKRVELTFQTPMGAFAVTRPILTPSQ